MIEQFPNGKQILAKNLCVNAKDGGGGAIESGCVGENIVFQIKRKHA